jgi:hypothetical protein
MDADFKPVMIEGPFGKPNLDPLYVSQREAQVTAAWRRLQQLPTLGLPITEYPLPK